ncbi:unnamed protein product [Closterium sp. NIES-53]
MYVLPLNCDEVREAEKARVHEQWDEAFLEYVGNVGCDELVCHLVNLVKRRRFAGYPRPPSSLGVVWLSYQLSVASRSSFAPVFASGLSGLSWRSCQGPVRTEISDLGAWLRPPRPPLFLPRKPPCAPLPALPVGPAAPGNPPRPAGIHAVRPPRGGPQLQPPLRLPLPGSVGGSIVGSCAFTSTTALGPDDPPGDDIGRVGTCGDSQPRRGPGAPGPSRAPGRLGVGWTRSFFPVFLRVAQAKAPAPGPGLSLPARPCPCMFAAAAATKVPADSVACGAVTSFGGPPCRLAAPATTAVISPVPSGAGDSANPGAVCNHSAARPPASGSGGAAGPTAEGEIKPLSEAAAAAPAADAAPAISAIGVPSRAVSVASAAAAMSVSSNGVTTSSSAADAAAKPVSAAPASAASTANSPGATVPSCPARTSCRC